MTGMPSPNHTISYCDATLGQFLDCLASGDATPGGGSASALAGALAAGLVGMVCRLTLDREKFAAVEEQILGLLAEAEMLRVRLTSAIDEDSAAYQAVLSAYGLPRSDEGQRSARAESIQAALKQATRVPLAVASDCARVLEMAQSVAVVGNPSASSDAAVGVLLAEAGLRGALQNVAINLPYIGDVCFVAEAQAEAERLSACSLKALDQR